MLELKDVSKSFSKTLFRNITFTLVQGQRLSIMGPSGSGKTTLLRCICGLDSFDSGSINLDGENIQNTPTEKRGIGLIFQKPVLYHHLNVSGNIKLGNKNADVSEILELIHLSGYENRRVDELSGGEAQRLALGRSIVAEPRFLLLDEPFSSLDETLRKKLLQETIELLEHKRIGSILVTHNHEEAKLFAENSILLDA